MLKKGRKTISESNFCSDMLINMEQGTGKYWTYSQPIYEVSMFSFVDDEGIEGNALFDCNNVIVYNSYFINCCS